MTALVVDASVAIKWVAPEPGSEAALQVRQGHRLLAPDLWAAECANIVWKKRRRGELDDAEAELACSLLRAADVELMPMRPLMSEALGIALRLDKPVYDALYLALALRERCTLVTADSRLADAAEAAGGEIASVIQRLDR